MQRNRDDSKDGNYGESVVLVKHVMFPILETIQTT